MKWNKLTGSIKDKKSTSTCELIELDGEPAWLCMNKSSTNEFGTRQIFKQGKLQEAYNWCKSQLQFYEQE